MSHDKSWSLNDERNRQFLFINNLTIGKHSNYLINKIYILKRDQISNFTDDNSNSGYLYNAVLKRVVIGCYQDINCKSVYCYNLEYTGTSLTTKNETKIFINDCGTTSCNDPKNSFSLYKVSDNKAIVSCGYGSLKMVIIDDDFNTINILHSDQELNYDFMDITMLNEYKMIISMKNINGYYYSIYYFPKCVEQLNIFVKRKEKFFIKEIFENITLTGTYITKETKSIKFTSNTYGKIFENENIIESGVIKNIENLYYYHTLNEEITFYYKGIEYKTMKNEQNIFEEIYSDECELKIKTCYISCDQCDEIGDSINNKCINCNNEYNYYWNERIGNNCIEKPSNYYIDDITYIEPVVKPCYSLCSTCLIGGNDEIHNCITCINGYHKIEDNLIPNNCYSNKPGDNYYFEDNTYKKCHDNCLTCNEGPSDDDNKCTSCINNYYFIYGSNKNTCYNEAPDGYYFNISNNIYNACHSNCISCYGYGTNNKNNCKKCSIGHLIENDNNHNCITLKPGINYYVDLSDDTYKKCHDNCLSCDEGGDDINNKCISCIEGYSFWEGYGNTCYNNKPGENYYLNIEDNIYMKCHDNCLSCEEKGDENDNKCKSCRNDFNLINNNCVLNIDKSNDGIFININKNKEELLYLISLNLDYFLKVNKIIKGKDFFIELLKSNENNKFIDIDFSTCINKLNIKDYIILKIESNENLNSLLKEIEFKILNLKGEEIDISKCENEKLLINFSLNEKNININLWEELNKKYGYDIFDINNNFYKDYCCIFHHENYDIIIDDRKKYFYNNLNLCNEKNCDYINYDNKIKKVKCECNYTLNNFFDKSNNQKYIIIQIMNFL